MRKNVKKYYANLTRSQQIEVYRKKNAAIRHEYYTLSSRHSSMEKCMLTFTASGKGRGVYTKLRLINELKKHLVHLINVSSFEIYHFTVIEMGHSFTNPHLHVQLWYDDFEAVQSIYDKVIERFSLNETRCSLSTPQRSHDFNYNYIIKDFAKDLTDDYLWNLEQTKKRMRKTLGTKLRFYSRSKSKYTQKMYRFFYRAFNVIREKADEFIGWFYSIFFRKERTFKASTIFLNLYIEQVDESVFCLGIFSFLEFQSVLDFAPCLDPPL